MYLSRNKKNRTHDNNLIGFIKKDRLDSKIKEELIKKLKDKTITKEEKDLLIEDHITLAISILSHYKLSDFPIFLSEALYAIIIAIEQAPDKLYDNNLPAFISSKINSMVSDLILKNNIFNRKIKKKIISTDDYFDNIIFDIGKDDNNLKLLKIKNLINSCLKNEEEKLLIELREQNYKYKEITELIGLNKDKISKILDRIYDRVLDKLKECENAK